MVVGVLFSQFLKAMIFMWIVKSLKESLSINCFLEVQVNFQYILQNWFYVDSASVKDH